jgi:hypothetical protein
LHERFIRLVDVAVYEQSLTEPVSYYYDKIGSPR